MKRKKKLSKGFWKIIITVAVCCAVCLALIITNLFIPVKYLTSYLVLRTHGAQDGVMRVRYVDVGYGDCIIIELPDGKNMLIDAGNGISANQHRILRYLNKCGIDRIDYLVCSSVNPEHCGGLAEIIRYKTIGKIYMPYCTNVYINESYRDFYSAAKSSGAKCVYSEFGSGEFNDDYGYFFGILSPSSHLLDAEYYALNLNPTAENIANASAVIWLEYAGTRFLFTSDATRETLTRICDSYNAVKSTGDIYFNLNGYSVNLEDCDIFQVPRHGSTVNADFYGLINPSAAVISVGQNGYGCPSAEALSSVGNYVGDELYITQQHGTITVEVTEQGYSIALE